MCKGLTLKNIKCKKKSINDYCNYHTSQKPKPLPIKHNTDQKELKITSLKHEKLFLKFHNQIENYEKRITKINKKVDNQKKELNNYSECSRKKNEKINKIKERIKELEQNNKKYKRENEILEEKVNQSLNIINIKQKDKQKLIDKNRFLRDENQNLKQIADKYSIIVEFEKMKSQIKQIYNWTDQNFYIEVIRKERKYHSILENTFNMTIEDIIDEYWRLRRLRISYAHPFG